MLKKDMTKRELNKELRQATGVPNVVKIKTVIQAFEDGANSVDDDRYSDITAVLLILLIAFYGGDAFYSLADEDAPLAKKLGLSESTLSKLRDCFKELHDNADGDMLRHLIYVLFSSGFAWR